MIGSNTDTTAILDGFIITAGNAPDFIRGAGMYTSSGSPTVIGCTFIGNSTLRGGGGMANEDSSNPILVNCTFSGNSSGAGGGMWNLESSPILINCIFRENIASLVGGAMINVPRGMSRGPTMINCAFIRNSANIGGAVRSNTLGTLTFVNCTFSENWAYTAYGGLYTLYGSYAQLSNCILWGNSDSSGSGESAQIYRTDASVDIDYSIVQGWTGGLGGIGNIPDDPLFLDPESDDFRLFPSSPGVDSGDNAALPPDMADLDGDGDKAELIPLDLDGLPRIMGGVVDRGAYEQPDCNGNGISDQQDIAEGTSLDCNDNAVPDECEPDEDCNLNGAQDILTGA